MKMLSLALASALALTATTQAAPPKTSTPKQSFSPRAISQAPPVSTTPPISQPKVSQPRLSVPRTTPRFTQPKAAPRGSTLTFPDFRTTPKQPRVSIPAPRTTPKFTMPRGFTPPATTPRIPDTRGFRVLPGQIPTPPNFGPRVLRPGDANIPPRDVAPEGHREEFLDPNSRAFRPPTIPNVTPRVPDTRLRPEVVDLLKQPNLPLERNQPPLFDRDAMRPDVTSPGDLRPDVLDRIRPQDLRPRLPEGMFPERDANDEENRPGENRPQGNPGEQDRPGNGAPIPIPDRWGPLPLPDRLPDGEAGDHDAEDEIPPNQRPEPGHQGEVEEPNGDPDQANPHGGLNPDRPGHHHGRPVPLGPWVPDIFIDLFCGNHNIGYCVPGVVIQPGIGLGQYVTPIEPELIPALPKVENGDEVTLLLDEPIVVAEGVELRAVLVVGDRPMLIEVTDLQPTLVQVQLPTLLITGSEPATILLGLSSSGEVVYDRQLLIVPIDD